MLEQSLKKFIESYQDFPTKGILFRDLTPVFRNPNIFNELVSEMANLKIYKETEAIIAIDARGFLLGSPIALTLNKPLILARKPGKLPGEIFSKNYDLEYGKNSLSIQKEAIQNYDSFLIVDDLLATGGTVSCVSNLIISQGKEIKGLNVVIELMDLKGKEKFDFPVISHVKY